MFWVDQQNQVPVVQPVKFMNDIRINNDRLIFFNPFSVSSINGLFRQMLI